MKRQKARERGDRVGEREGLPAECGRKRVHKEKLRARSKLKSVIK